MHTNFTPARSLLMDKLELIRLIDLLLNNLLAETKGVSKIKTIFDCK